MNIKTKLSIRFTLMVMTIITLFCVFIYLFTLNHRKVVYQSRLEDRAKSVASLYQNKIENFNIKKDLASISSNNLTNESIYIINLKTNEEFTNGTAFLDSVKPELFLKENYAINDADFESEILRVNNKEQDFIVQIVAYDKYGVIRIDFLRLVLIVSWFISLIFTSVLSWFFVRNVLRPISNVVEQVNSISAHNLDARLNEGNGQDEIAKISITFNEMLERLEHSFNLQKTFVSNASHELKTPLTSITGQLEVALINDRNNNEYKEIISSVLDDIINLNKLTQQLLDYAQININNISIPLIQIRIDELILSVREDILKHYSDFNIKILFENFTEEESVLLINGNEHLLRIAFNNLLENAYKYSYNKEAIINFSIVGSTIKIIFKDFGIGISEEDLQKITEPFYRSQNVINIKGHGIGLSLTKRIIQLHNGDFEAISKINEGTSFIISIPNIQNS